MESNVLKFEESRGPKYGIWKCKAIGSVKRCWRGYKLKQTKQSSTYIYRGVSKLVICTTDKGHHTPQGQYFSSRTIMIHKMLWDHFIRYFNKVANLDNYSPGNYIFTSPPPHTFHTLQLVPEYPNMYGRKWPPSSIPRTTTAPSSLKGPVYTMHC